ncbi:MAG: FISUMP domain-containing protein [Marinifilaceae bacterium]
MRKLFIIGLAVLSLLTSCSKDDEISKVFKATDLIAPADKSSITGDNTTLEWKKSEDSSTKYDVFLGTKVELTDVEKVKTAISETKFKAINLISSTTYYWKIKSTNSAGKSIDSKIFSFTTGMKASNLIAPADKSIVVGNTVKLEWARNADATAKYDVFLGTNAEFTDAQKVVTGTSELTYSAENIKVATTYYWKVNTINSKGETLTTSTFSFSNGLPTTPVLTSPANNANLIKLTTKFVWSKATLFNGAEVTYNIYYAPTADFATAAVKTADITATEFSLAGLKEATAYSWKVVAKNAAGNIAESEVFTFTTHTVPVTTLLLPTNGSTGSAPALLKWKIKEGFTYNVYLSKGTSTFAAANIVKANVAVDNFVLTGIELGFTYYWKIQAVNSIGTKFESETFSFVTKAKPADEGEFVDRDGHVYKTLKIAGSEWLAENYAFIPAPSSNYLWMIPNRSAKDPAYSNPAEDVNYKKYGLLYTLEAIKEVLPVGWHIATDEEWNALEVSLGMDEAGKTITGTRGTHASKLRSNDGSWTVDATNSSKMSILPAGKGTFSPFGSGTADFGKSAWLWTSTLVVNGYGSTYYRKVFNGAEDGVKRYKDRGITRMSVRLVKDAK